MFNEKLIDVIVNDSHKRPSGLWQDVHDNLHAIEAVCLDYDINFIEYLCALLAEAINNEGKKIFDDESGDAIISRIEELNAAYGFRD